METLEILQPITKTWDGKIVKIKINTFDVKYSPEQNNFKIEIIGWGVEDNSQGWCAYSNMREILTNYNENPLIFNFRKKYFVEDINWDCRCGSDHK